MTLQEAKAKVLEALEAVPEGVDDTFAEILKAIILAIEELQS